MAARFYPLLRTAGGVAIGVTGATGLFLAFPGLLPSQGISRSSVPPWERAWGTRWDDRWDQGASHNADSSAAAAPRSVRRQLILIRHGQYLDSGDNFLNERGVKQAVEAGKRLKQLCDPQGCPLVSPEISALWCSDLKRARQTAGIIAEQVGFPADKIQVCNLLREGMPCEPQPTIPKIAKLSVEQRKRHAERAEQAFRKFVRRPSAGKADSQPPTSTVEVVVGHANVFRYFVCRGLQLPPEAWLRLSLPHASFTMLSIYGDGTVRLLELGNSGHLPPEMIT
eukprot:RCo050350